MCRLEVVQIHLLFGDSRYVPAWLLDLRGRFSFGLDWFLPLLIKIFWK